MLSLSNYEIWHHCQLLFFAISCLITPRRTTRSQHNGPISKMRLVSDKQKINVIKGNDDNSKLI